MIRNKVTMLIMIILLLKAIDGYVVGQCSVKLRCLKHSYGQIIMCQSDSDCPVDEICCKTKCGIGCVGKL